LIIKAHNKPSPQFKPPLKVAVKPPIINNTDNNNIKEEKAWTKKYFKHDSALDKLRRFNRIGIKLIKLTSNPTQAPNHVGAEIVKTNENPIKIMNKRRDGIYIIRIRIKSIYRV
jgi:hypothetical protein